VCADHSFRITRILLLCLFGFFLQSKRTHKYGNTVRNIDTTPTREKRKGKIGEEEMFDQRFQVNRHNI